MDPGQLIRGRTRETKIRRDAAGRWYDGEDRIDHPKLVEAFDGWVDRAEDGRFCLSNDINWAYVEIEGPAYFVKDVRTEPEGLGLRLSGGREEWLDPDTLCQDAQGVLWCAVRQGRCPARFESHAMGKIGELVGQDDEGVYLRVGSRTVHPPEQADPLSLGLEKG